MGKFENLKIPHVQSTKTLTMKKLYTVLLAVLLALPLFAVEYQAPVTVWEGTCGELYGNDKCVIVPQSEYDWTKVVADARLTIYFQDAITSQTKYLFLWACESKEKFEANTYFELGDSENSYDLNVGDTQFQIVFDKDDVTAFGLIPSLFVWVSNPDEPVFTKITIEYPASATALQSVSTENIYATEGTIVAPEAAQIYSITGQNVTLSNGNLARGIYVVRHGNQTTKVVMK